MMVDCFYRDGILAKRLRELIATFTTGMRLDLDQALCSTSWTGFTSSIFSMTPLLLILTHSSRSRKGGTPSFRSGCLQLCRRNRKAIHPERSTRHVEGGIRAVDRLNPEEINRRVSDVLADVIFCCTKTDVNNLHKEGYDPERVEFTGDLMKDALLMMLKKYGIKVSRGDYLVLTLHRQENLVDGARLRAIFSGLIDAGRRIIFPAHPRTLKSMKDFGVLEMLQGSQIELCKPMGYVAFLRLTAGADKILTDSGGVRREAYLLKKPCVVLIELSWFPEISQAGWKVLTGPDPGRIADLIKTFEPTGVHQELFGDGAAHAKIVGGLMRRYAR